MFHLSVKIPQELHQQLETKTQEMGLPYMSDTVRILLSEALEKIETDNPQKIQYKILEHVVASYYLFSEQLANTGESGLKINHRAHERSQVAMAKILE